MLLSGAVVSVCFLRVVTASRAETKQAPLYLIDVAGKVTVV